MIRDDIKAAQVTAMKAGDKEARAAIGLIQAAIKNRDIELRTGTAPTDDDAVVVEVLQKMVKQRRESIQMYESGGRQELADAEKAEVAVIERFLPAQMSDAETTAAIEATYVPPKKHIPRPISACRMSMGSVWYAETASSTIFT